MDESDFLTSLLTTCPNCLEMDRDEFPPVKQSRQESLLQKLHAHYQKGIGPARHDDMPSSFPDELANRVGILLYLSTVVSTLIIGVVYVMPLIYEGNDTIVLLQQLLVCFIFLEVMVNWLGIRYVGSSYHEYISANGNQYLHKQSIAMLQTTQHHEHTRAFSSVMLVPPQEETEQQFVARKNHPLKSVDAGNSLSKNCFVSRRELVQEAANVNKWMHTRNEMINSKSIDDLIFATGNNKSSYASQQLQDSPAAKGETYNVTLPKAAVKVDGHYVTETYSYWSWVPCYSCGFTRPPRCHHCPLCKTCVLKRDHHCYFAGSCIGYRNHRFFIVFLFWALIGCVYATLHGIPYLFRIMWSQMSFWDIFFPLTIIRFIFGNVPFFTVLSVTTLCFILASSCFSAFYLVLQLRLIISGLTSFEKACLKSSLEIIDTRRLNRKMKAVFGRYWLLNFIFPTHFFIKPEEDPVYWPDIQICKR